METRKLHHAVVLARLLNFTKAAEALNLTQPALSRSIQALEDEFQLRLFDRSRHAVEITQAGRDFISHAEALLRSETRLLNIIGQTARGEGGRVAMGMGPLAVRMLLEPLLSEMVDRPGFHSSVTIDTPDRMRAMVIEESLDLCVCAGQDTPVHAPLSSTLLAHFPLCVIVRKDHPLTRLPAFRQEDIDRFPLVRARPFDSDDDLTLMLMGQTKEKLPAVTVADDAALMQITARSNAVWITTPILVKEGLQNGSLVRLPLPWHAPTPTLALTVYVLKRRSQSPIVRNILKRLIALGNELAASNRW